MLLLGGRHIRRHSEYFIVTRLVLPMLIFSPWQRLNKILERRPGIFFFLVLVAKVSLGQEMFIWQGSLNFCV
jgi:hypothetical protein